MTHEERQRKRAYNRELQRRIRQRRKEAGLCRPCGAPLDVAHSSYFCGACLKRHREGERKRNGRVSMAELVASGFFKAPPKKRRKTISKASKGKS